MGGGLAILLGGGFTMSDLADPAKREGIITTVRQLGPLLVGLTALVFLMRYIPIVGAGLLARYDSTLQTFRDEMAAEREMCQRAFAAQAQLLERLVERVEAVARDDAARAKPTPAHDHPHRRPRDHRED